MSRLDRPMRPWLRRLVVRILAYAIQRRPDHLLELRHAIDRAFPHRCPQETGEIWREAYAKIHGADA